MPKLPDADDHTTILLSFISATARLLEEQCRARWNISAKDFLYNMVDEFLFGSRPDKNESPGSDPAAKPVLSASDLDGQQRFFLVLHSFAEAVPFEIAVKAVISGKITYLWANELFLRMAGVSQLADILHKTTEEVWPLDRARAKRIHDLDETLISTKRTVTHVDSVRHGDHERARVGVRFLIGPREGHVLIIGSIGIDFKSKEAAEYSRAEMGTDGEFTPVAKRKARPKRT
jgi:hypothetical protein